MKKLITIKYAKKGRTTAGVLLYVGSLDEYIQTETKDVDY
jgi:hypothetical protein